MSPNLLLVLHAALTWALVGLIWIVQLIQYPLFARVDRASFPEFHRLHASRITWLVAPLMGGELLTGLVLVSEPPPEVPSLLLWVGLALILVNALTTAFVSAPLHGKLGAHYREADQERLVATNWIRTAAWSARGVLVGWMLLRVLG